jgi:geranylgeranyl reductase family protein
MDSIKTDVLVVGAGPAGTTVANLLAKANIKVMLVDRCKFPRDKVCGDVLTPLALKILQDIELIPDIQGQFYPLTGSRLYIKENIEHKEERFHSLPYFGYAAPRLLLDQVLLDGAIRRGATFLPEVNIQNPRIDSNNVIGAIGKCNGREISFDAKITICADGSAGGYTRKLGLGERNGSNPIAARAYYYGVKNIDHALEFYYWKEFLPYYAWIFPVKEDVCNIGVAISTEKSRRIHIQQMFSDFIKTLSDITGRFGSAYQISECKAFPVDTSFAPMKSFTSGAIAVGDAAGLVHPATGAGIGYAMESGTIATRHILRSLQSGDTSIQAFRGYGVDLARRYQLSFQLANLIKRWMRNPGTALRLVKLLQYT